MTVCNIGDSRCLLGQNSSKLVALTEDHKPQNPIEYERIKKAGGFVESSRVDGQLALSRAFGDSRYKRNKNLSQEEQKVIPVPDITKFHLAHDDFLLICCDGIFESFSNEKTIEFVSKALKTTEDLAQIMADLLDAVLNAGSNDNMTAILILPKNGQDYNQEKDQFIPGPFFKDDKYFVNAYTEDCKKYGYTLEEALQVLEKSKSNS